ncbi:hypothetical protein QBC44DRAFT_368668 [Cladorrhinum sp. PSN332]|nr:hypothetical protein QBC44DRAFT_368668 [Cladorrhinum sp. PSN332]
MKFSLYFITALAAGVFAAPSEDIEPRAACINKSACSTAWGGLCEGYCGQYGRYFSHMTGTGCSVFSKACCCKNSK